MADNPQRPTPAVTSLDSPITASPMNRRTFLLRSSGIALTAWLAPSAPRAFAAPPAATDRLALGTVLFRYRFKQTRPQTITPRGSDLTLLDVPQYYRDRFGLSQVEFWSNHFESLEPAYLDAVKAKLRAARTTLINVQVDADYNLAAPDEERRRASIATAKQWIDAAAHLGSTAVRINPGNGAVESSIASLREVNAHAKSRGLPLLTENHFGIEMDPDVHLRIRREVDPENVYTLPDFGNYNDDARMTALEKILPHAWLISAKVVEFNDAMEHVSYDFDACVRLAERLGFKGVYSVEQWSRREQDLDYEQVVDWLLAHVRANV
jgi:sugar phosphate isomerase/epimerase